ncbi:ATP-binding protein [Mucilaginibacter yixingensis]|nr:ATP-binding protein [Mucilaginibacter yixingensis]
MWGRSEDEVLHLPILEAMPELKAQGIDELLNAVYHGGEKFYFTERPVDLRRGDHLETLYLNFSYEPLYDADGVINGFITIGTDVTEQVNARLALARTEEMLRFSVDAAGAATWHMDIATRSFVFSEGMKSLYGFRAEEEAGYDDLLARVPAPYQQTLKEQVEQTIADGSPYLNEHPVKMPDDRERWVRAIGKRYPGEGKWGAHFSGLVIDITDEKLEDMRKSGFIGMASHELKTPLTSLSAIIQVAGLKLKDSEDAFLKGAMERANNQVKRMTAMINGFLNISRLESGKLIIDKENFDLEALMRDIADEISLTATNHEIELDLCGYLGIRADRDKVGSVISNLLSNAVKYSPPGTTIRVKCGIEGKYVQISVRDEGMGIDAIDIKRLFDRYYRVESSRTKHISGFGIGLYLCSEIIKQHGGKIWAESTLGQGSTFYFTLPLIG